ncbi:hypothetical protein HX773_24630 [Pantoea sp. B9002]|uniref:hypothetical protein n=1 Tax=Pantoea sp. B9002 TaxID=2726979 RepID=UPI00159FD704|nr:hypothetical protein [Pantoea sp. B9002]NWA64088.1 hypothetical protein [Pantoea sp. B9002]
MVNNIMFFPFILSPILLVTGFAGLRYIPKSHRTYRQLAAGLLNLGFIMLVCSALAWLFSVYWINNPPAITRR